MMAWDLWGPPYYSVEEESSFCNQPEWQCDHYFSYGFDVLEENALNEKCCIEVLKILITKADSEIDQLEQDLVLLQGELAWMENEEWSQVCHKTLREKIHCLNVLIRNLKDRDKNDIEVCLLTHTQPVERLYDILKALLANQLQKEEVQSGNVKDAVVSILDLDADGRSTKMLHKDKKRGNCDQDIVMHDEIKDSDAIIEHSANFKSSLKCQEKKINNL